MRTLASTLAVVAVTFAFPVAFADLTQGESQRYVGFRTATNACGFTLGDDDLVGGVCFDVDPAVHGRRMHILVDDDFGENTYSYYEMTDSHGNLKVIGHFCGQTTTPTVPASVTKISVSVYPGVFVRNCAGSAGTGLSGSIFAKALEPPYTS